MRDYLQEKGEYKVAASLKRPLCYSNGSGKKNGPLEHPSQLGLSSMERLMNRGTSELLQSGNFN